MIQRINKSHEKTSSKKRTGFVYHKRSPDAVKKRAEQTGGRFDSIFKSGIDTFKPKQGANIVRFLPPTWDNHDHYGLDVYVHGFVGPNKGSYLCPLKMNKSKKCPLCELEQELRKGGEQDEANQIAAKKRVLAWIIDRDDKTPTPTIWNMGWTHDRDISDLARNKRTGETLLIDHPDEGFDVSFTRKGTTKNNTEYYGWQIERASSPIADRTKDQDEILDYIQENPLPDMLTFVDAAKLQQVVEGTAEEPDEDAEEEEDERPQKAKRARDEDEEEEEEEDERPAKKSRRARDEDEDEPEESEDEPTEEDEDEEDDRPSRTKSRRAAEDDDEEEEEDEKPAKRVRLKKDDDEDEEEEEEEPPRKKKKYHNDYEEEDE